MGAMLLEHFAHALGSQQNRTLGSHGNTTASDFGFTHNSANKLTHRNVTSKHMTEHRHTHSDGRSTRTDTQLFARNKQMIARICRRLAHDNAHQQPHDCGNKQKKQMTIATSRQTTTSVKKQKNQSCFCFSVWSFVCLCA